jgi:hypothetical protein
MQIAGFASTTSALALACLLSSVAPLVATEKVKPEEIIQKFAAKESEFRDVWEQYTYTQRIVFQVIGRSGQAKEQREMIVEVYYTKEGERETRVVSDRGALSSVGVSREDISDAISMQPFVLTTEELAKYKIKYKGEETVDELDTYVFDVNPAKMKKRERYFKGRIWVDNVDFQIVMTKGKIVPDYRDNKFPEFETVREQIDSEYWFPTWTEADDVLHFGGYNSVHVRQLITYGNFQKFEVGTAIKYGSVTEGEEDPPQ